MQHSESTIRAVLHRAICYSPASQRRRRVDAVQEEAGPQGTGTGRCSVGHLEMITGALTLRTNNIAPSEEGYQFMSVEELQAGVRRITPACIRPHRMAMNL